MAVTAVASNFPITIAKDAVAYCNNVKIVFHQNGQQDPICRTEKSNFDTKIINRRIIDEIISKNFPELKNVELVYDGMETLWTREALKEPFKCSFLEQDLPDSVSGAFYGTGKLQVDIIPNTKTPMIKINNFSTYQKQDYWKKEDRTLRNLLELITSEYALRNGFSQLKSGNLFGPEEPFTRGLVARQGCKKGVQFIDDSSSNFGVRPVLSLDSVKKVFYPADKTFLEVYNDFIENSESPEEATKLFHGVKLRSLVSSGRIFTFKEFGDSVENTKDFDIVGHHRREYGVELRCLDKPTAVMKGAMGNFPLELLGILPDQPVPFFNLPQNLEMRQKSLNIVSPTKRHQDIMNVLEMLQLQNPITTAFGITVDENMMKVKHEILNKPKIEASEVLSSKNTTGAFQYLEKTKFLLPAEIKNCGILCEQRHKTIAENFSKEIRNNLISRGVEFPKPSIIFVNFNKMNIKNLKKTITDNKLNFVIVISDNDKVHSDLKLAESQIPGVVTQQLTFHIAKDIAGGKNKTICMNFCMKINVKNGGLNHRVIMKSLKSPWNINDKNILILGLDVNHPTGDNYRGEQTQPSIVGFTANYANNPNAFMGDFFFQKPRQENIDPTKLQNYVTMVYKKFCKNGRDFPTHVVILRDGVSEGQYKMVIDEEFEAIKTAASKFGQKPPQFTLMILTKTHNTRHFLKKNSGIQNLASGTCIYDGVRKNMIQFYIAPHNAFQGSCQDILVTVLVNEPGISKETAKHFIHGLCYLHQIVNAPISLPEPVYQADELAKRGMIVYKAAKENKLINRIKIGSTTDSESENYDYLTSLLSYGKNNLPDIRYNA